MKAVKGVYMRHYLVYERANSLCLEYVRCLANNLFITHTHHQIR